jgi:hypothetical protein
MNPSSICRTIRVSNTCRRGVVPLQGIIFLLFLVLVSFTIEIHGQESGYTLADFESMTNEELEDICIQRGFELIKDDVDLQREDYIEAAQRCLTIEQEM